MQYNNIGDMAESTRMAASIINTDINKQILLKEFMEEWCKSPDSVDTKLLLKQLAIKTGRNYV